MFCPKCGAQIPDNTAFCPNCGAAIGNGAQSFVNGAMNAAENAFNATEKELGNAARDITQNLGNNGNGYYGGERLKEDRSLLIYIILSIITCGIYSYYFIYQMAHDINIACEGDGESTAGLIKFIVLSFITCGIYSLFWEYSLGNRLANNAPRYGLTFQENGTSILMWYLFGMLLCFIGPYVAMHILIKNSNKICAAYNRANGL